MRHEPTGLLQNQAAAEATALQPEAGAAVQEVTAAADHPSEAQVRAEVHGVQAEPVHRLLHHQEEEGN